METAQNPFVVEAERVRGGAVFVTFDDGSSAIYSAALLHSFFAQAVEVVQAEPE
jgi:hypothetical protein